jgi:hypothetical protein
MAKIIAINDTRFVLPEGMTTKEIQALAGMLATLVTVEYKYDDLTYDRYYYASSAGSQLSITDAEIMTKEAAVAKAKVKREAKEAEEAAAKAKAAAEAEA